MQSQQWKYYIVNTNFLLSDLTAVYFVTYNNQTLKLFTAMQFSEAMPEVSKYQRGNLPFCYTYCFISFSAQNSHNSILQFSLKGTTLELIRCKSAVLVFVEDPWTAEPRFMEKKKLKHE